MKVKALVNCNLYADGGSFLGAMASITLPEVKHKATEHKAGDGIGTPKLPGAMEALQVTIKMNGMYEDFHALTANPDRIVSVMVRANQKTRNGLGNFVNEPVIVMLRGWFSSRKIGELQGGGEGAKPEYVMEVFYYHLIVNSLPVEEVDVENSVHRVEGVDVLKDFRDNLGI